MSGGVCYSSYRRIIIHAISKRATCDDIARHRRSTSFDAVSNPYKCANDRGVRIVSYHNTHKYYVSLMWYFTDYESARACDDDLGRSQFHVCIPPDRCKTITVQAAILEVVVAGVKGGVTSARRVMTANYASAAQCKGVR